MIGVFGAEKGVFPLFCHVCGRKEEVRFIMHCVGEENHFVTKGGVIRNSFLKPDGLVSPSETSAEEWNRLLVYNCFRRGRQRILENALCADKMIPILRIHTQKMDRIPCVLKFALCLRTEQISETHGTSLTKLTFVKLYVA